MGFVKVEQQGHVGILTIDRQEALNALNSQVLNDLDAAIDEVAANDDVYVVVLTGAGRSFVAGADTELIREEHLRRLEVHLREAVALSRLCDLDLDGLTGILSMLYKEEDL